MLELRGLKKTIVTARVAQQREISDLGLLISRFSQLLPNLAGLNPTRSSSEPRDAEHPDHGTLNGRQLGDSGLPKTETLQKPSINHFDPIMGSQRARSMVGEALQHFILSLTALSMR